MKKIFTRDALSTIVFNVSILFFIIGLGFTDTPTPFGWYQQFMPNLNGHQISDIFFLDSLTGWAVTPGVVLNDTAYVLKTTNSGDNWFIANVRTGQFVGHNKIKFLNSLTGFVCGNFQTTGYRGINKSTDGGFNWIALNNPPTTAVFDDMAILDENTIWLAASSSAGGGVFFTSNGGTNWIYQASFGSSNPAHIYMYNANLGFIDAGGLRRTTDGGTTWTPIPGAGNFLDMHFKDSLTGWKCNQDMKKTTDGGLTWSIETLPNGGNILFNYLINFSNVNKDTLWGVGGNLFYGGGQFRGMIYHTTNGGNNWLFQIPDTSIHIGLYNFSKFINKLNGWAYSGGPGVHTVTGGNDTNYTALKQISNNVPSKFVLFQNYPNPFNPVTKIKYDLSEVKDSKLGVRLEIYNILGKEIKTIVNKTQGSGEYEVEFNGSNLSSGVYFYSLIVDGNLIDTKKMILLK